MVTTLFAMSLVATRWEDLLLGLSLFTFVDFVLINASERSNAEATNDPRRDATAHSPSESIPQG